MDEPVAADVSPLHQTRPNA